MKQAILLIQTSYPMSTLSYAEAAVQYPAQGVERRIIHTPTLMTVIIDFNNGPQTEPDPPHSHPHEQTSYVAEGEILFFLADEPARHLKAGDMFGVPAHLPHCIQLLTSKVRLVDSFSPIREDFLY